MPVIIPCTITLNDGRTALAPLSGHYLYAIPPFFVGMRLDCVTFEDKHRGLMAGNFRELRESEKRPLATAEEWLALYERRT